MFRSESSGGPSKRDYEAMHRANVKCLGAALQWVLIIPILLLMLATCAGALVLVRQMAIGPSAGIALMFAALTAIGLGTSWVCSPILARARWGRWVPAALEEGLCPSCAYSLREVGAASDGCRQCPECGAAWRVPGAARGV